MLNYQVTAIGDDWVEIWDGTSKIDKTTRPSTDQVFIGKGHRFQVGDTVALQVILVSRPVVEEEDVPSDQLWGELMAGGCDTEPDDGSVTP